MEASGKQDLILLSVKYRVESGLGEGACYLVQEQREKRLKRVYKFNFVPLNTIILRTVQLLVHGLEIFVHITEELLHMAFQIEYISVFLFWIRSRWNSLIGKHQSSVFPLISFLVPFYNYPTLSQGYIL